MLPTMSVISELLEGKEDMIYSIHFLSEGQSVIITANTMSQEEELLSFIREQGLSANIVNGYDYSGVEVK